MVRILQRSFNISRSAEFFILHSPALIPQFPQSPSSSYLFSHRLNVKELPIRLGYLGYVAIALKLLPVFTLCDAPDKG